MGVILYEMVVGHPPFLASTPEETQRKVSKFKKCRIFFAENLYIYSSFLDCKLEGDSRNSVGFSSEL